MPTSSHLPVSSISMRCWNNMGPKAHFHRNPVQSVSRPLWCDESYLLRRFEDRIYDHLSCYNVVRGGDRDDICFLCLDMTVRIMSSFRHRAGRFTHARSDDNILTYVEIPRYYLATRRILETTSIEILQMLRAIRERKFGCDETPESRTHKAIRSRTYTSRHVYKSQVRYFVDEQSVLCALRRLGVSPGDELYERRVRTARIRMPV